MKCSSRGQSTIEFVLTLTLLMSFIFFFFQLSMIMGFGNYVQYATFMAARAYLAAGPDKNDQQDRARAVINSMLKKPGGGADRFPMFAKGTGGNDGAATGLSFDPLPPGGNLTDPNFSWVQGVRYDLEGHVWLMPFGAKGFVKSPQNLINLHSESYLGRENSFSECNDEMQSNRSGGLIDNGC